MALNVSELRDAQTDKERVVDPKVGLGLLLGLGLLGLAAHCLLCCWAWRCCAAACYCPPRLCAFIGNSCAAGMLAHLAVFHSHSAGAFAVCIWRCLAPGPASGPVLHLWPSWGSARWLAGVGGHLVACSAHFSTCAPSR